MVTKVNDTVFDGTTPRVSDLDVTNFDATNGTVQTTAAVSKQIVNFETMIAALTLAVPAGVVVPFAGPSSPSADWLLCDGSSKSTGAYPSLFAAIGYTYGGGGASFNVPDLRGRGVSMLDGGVGRVTAPAGNTLGGSLGFDEITLSMAEMPSHNHSVSGSTSSSGLHNHTGSSFSGSTNTAGNHSHPFGAQFAGNTEGGGGDTEMQPRNTGDAGSHSHSISGTVTISNGGNHTHSVSISESNRGSSSPHDNMQPTLFMNYIIKAT